MDKTTLDQTVGNVDSCGQPQLIRIRLDDGDDDILSVLFGFMNDKFPATSS